MSDTIEMPGTLTEPAPVKRETNEKKPVKKVLIICSKGKLEDVYAALVMANGAPSR